MALRLQTPAHIAQGEVRIGLLRHGQRLDAVSLVLVGCRLQGILQAHVRIEGVIAGTHLILRD